MYTCFKLFYRFLAALILLMSLALPAYAQFGAMVSNDNNDKTEKTEQDAATDENPELNLSDAIPIDEVLASWETKYSEIMTSIGLDDSLGAKFIASIFIILFFFIVLYIFKKITLLIRKRFHLIAHKFNLNEDNIDFYHRAVNWLVRIILIICTITALLMTWQIDINNYISDEFISSAIANLLTIFFIIIMGKLAIDIACGLVEKGFHKWGTASQARVNTLLPIARNTVYIVFITLFSLMLLSEIGINVMPLLAGAGVLGFAIGFGAQTIIKDLLTGFIIILEDLIQVGDVVTLAGCTGAIEKITIRKVQLRNLDGTVYTVPFSEINIVSNLTKEYSVAMFEVGIAYREDVDEVNKLLISIDEEIRSDENYQNDILEPLEIFGLDKFGDSAVVIKARLKTKPASQWSVGREFNRRMKMLFDEKNIEIPFPHQTIYFGEDKNGNAPPLMHKRVGHNSKDEKDDSIEDNVSSSNSSTNTDTKPTNTTKKNQPGSDRDEDVVED